MKKRRYFILSIMLVLTIGLFTTIAVQAVADTNSNVICNNVYIGDIDVSGMTEENANKVVEDYVDSLKTRKLTVKVGNKQASVKLEKLGYSYAENNHVKDALNIGKSGNLIKRYKELKDVENEKLVYPIEFMLDDAKVKNFVEKECAAYDVEPKDATLKRENGKFVVSEDVVGKKVVVDETVEKIKSSVLDGWDGKDIEIDAVVIEALPKYTKEDLENCNTIIGSYSTTYQSSSESRASNLANGAKLINGTIIYPGEEFSTSKRMEPFTIENGYKAASAYSSGKVIDSIGGGVCQVSTTLYNAILKSELEVVERFPHSMIVTYVEPAMDAAIAENYKDLKFKNNTDAPIYIEAYTSDRTITFNIWGHETRDLKKREVKYESETVAVIQPGPDKITYDSTKPASYVRVDQGAHVGYQAYLYKVVYEDGKQVSKEKVNFSTYAAEPRHVTKGSMGTATEKPKESEAPKESEEPKESELPKESEKPKNTTKPASGKDVPTITKKPGDVETSKPTQKPVSKPTKKPDPTPKPTEESTEEPIATPKPTEEPVVEPSTEEPIQDPGLIDEPVTEPQSDSSQEVVNEEEPITE